MMLQTLRQRKTRKQLTPVTLAQRVLLLLAVAGLVCAIAVSSGTATLEAHKGHDHTVMGTITMAGPDHVMVKVTDPKTKQESVKTIAITPKTKLLKGVPAAPAKAADLTVGSRVVVNIGEGEEPLSAKEIRIGAGGAAATHGTK